MEREHCVGVLLYGPDPDLAACGLPCAAAHQPITTHCTAGRGQSPRVRCDLVQGDTAAVGLALFPPSFPSCTPSGRACCRQTQPQPGIPTCLEGSSDQRAAASSHHHDVNQAFWAAVLVRPGRASCLCLTPGRMPLLQSLADGRLVGGVLGLVLLKHLVCLGLQVVLQRLQRHLHAGPVSTCPSSQSRRGALHVDHSRQQCGDRSCMCTASLSFSRHPPQQTWHRM